MRINYHPGKANVVADALSRKMHCNTMTAREIPPELCKEFERLNFCMVNSAEAMVMEVDSTLEEEFARDSWKMKGSRRSSS